MPATVLVQITVADHDRFLAGFRERGLPLRRRHGSAGARVMQSAEDPAEVAILFDWASHEAFRGFLADPEVQGSMRAGGTLGPPRITYVGRVDELDA